MRIVQADENFQLPENSLCRTARGWGYQAEPLILQLEVGMTLEEAFSHIELESRPVLGPGHIIFFQITDPEHIRGFLTFHPIVQDDAE